MENINPSVDGEKGANDELGEISKISPVGTLVILRFRFILFIMQEGE